MFYTYGSRANTEPLTVDKVKAYLKIEHNEDDDLILDLIAIKRAYIEESYNHNLIGGSIVINCLYKRVIQLPVMPIADLVSVKLYDSDGVVIPYTVKTSEIRKGQGVLILDESQLSDLDSSREIEIVINVGYESIDDIPKPIIHALMLLVGSAYDCRGDKETNPRMSTAARDLLEPYRYRKIY